MNFSDDRFANVAANVAVFWLAAPMIVAALMDWI